MLGAERGRAALAALEPKVEVATARESGMGGHGSMANLQDAHEGFHVVPCESDQGSLRVRELCLGTVDSLHHGTCAVQSTKDTSSEVWACSAGHQATWKIGVKRSHVLFRMPRACFFVAFVLSA